MTVYNHGTCTRCGGRTDAQDGFGRCPDCQEAVSGRDRPTSKARGPWSTVRGPVGGWRVVNRDTGQWYAVASQPAGHQHCRNLNAGITI